MTAAALVAAISISSYAQEYSRGSGQLPFRHDFRAGYSVWPVAASNMYYGGYSYGRGTIEDAMRDYPGDVWCTGAVTAEFGWIIRKWFTMSAGIGYNHFWKGIYAASDDSRVRTDHAGVIYLMPQARFSYFVRKYVTLYSSAGIGLSIYHNRTHGHGFYDDMGGNDAYIMFQAVPIGITVGNRVFGFTELGAGGVWIGIRAGVGYRF